ncbi:unnamed protein product [Fraxinus pennsylvanica]|uniref:Uncharacterized protein n=1 Tax=Fraxinus pennsylvanica TaxID=56036 RepID=A0AAD1Z8R3_9LAMI|nr:unnamed protein product [Fraxinus pennsylvanica]
MDVEVEVKLDEENENEIKEKMIDDLMETEEAEGEAPYDVVREIDVYFAPSIDPNTRKSNGLLNLGGSIEGFAASDVDMMSKLDLDCKWENEISNVRSSEGNTRILDDFRDTEDGKDCHRDVKERNDEGEKMKLCQDDWDDFVQESVDHNHVSLVQSLSSCVVTDDAESYPIDIEESRGDKVFVEEAGSNNVENVDTLVKNNVRNLGSLENLSLDQKYVDDSKSNYDEMREKGDKTGMSTMKEEGILESVIPPSDTTREAVFVGFTNSLQFDTIKFENQADIITVRKLFPNQGAVLEPTMQGRDMIDRERTRTGKTLAFGIPIMDKITQFIEKYGR